MAVKFNLDQLAATSVTKAELSLYQYFDEMNFAQDSSNCGNSGFNPVNLVLHKISQDWSPANIDFGDVSNGESSFATFSNKSQWPAMDSSLTSTYTYDGTSINQWHTWDVTGLVNAILGGAPNYGFMIYADLPQEWYEFGTLVGNWYASSENTTLGIQYRPKLTLTIGNTATDAAKQPISTAAVSLKGRTLQLSNLSPDCRELQIVNLRGQRVATAVLSRGETQSIILPQTLSPGVYVASIIREGGRPMQRKMTLF